MTISNNYVPTKQLGDGVTSIYTANWPLLAAAYIRVYLQNVVTGVQVLAVNGTDYSLTFNSTILTVTFLPGKIPTNANYVILSRSITKDQIVPFKTSKGFDGIIVEQEVDKLTAITQDLQDQIDRAPKAPVGSGLNLNLPTPVAGKALIWNVGLTALINSTYSVDDAVTLATAQAVIASNAATAAGTSATNAGTSESNSLTYRNDAQAAAAAAQAAAAGIKWKNSVRAATTAALVASTYNNGSSGVGATLTRSTNGILATQDGISLNVGDRLLVKNQASLLQNGIYTVTDLGSGSSPFILTRAIDIDQWVELPSATVGIEEGTTQGDQIWICTANQGGAIGVNTINWVLYSGAAANKTFDIFSGTGAQTVFNLAGAPGSNANADVFISGVRQRPTTDYSVSGTILTFVTAPASGASNVLVVYGTTQAINVPATGSVIFASIASAALASQAQAQAGTDNTTLMTPLRTAQAVAALSGIFQPAATALTGQTSYSATGLQAASAKNPIKRLTVIGAGIQTNAGAGFKLQIGDTAGLKVAGYLGISQRDGVSGGNLSTDIRSEATPGGEALSVKYVIELVDAATFLYQFELTIGRTASASSPGYYTRGYVTLAGLLDRFSLTTTTGTDTLNGVANWKAE